jgi:hypothetical protein
MTTKITLTIDRSLAERAKKYARSKKMTFDKMIEQQVESLLKTEDDDIRPAVKELAGILKDIKAKDAKKEFRKHVLKKHRI